ncbi:hypothetical protein [Actinomadura hibisca]|uniref:hypothetical protein n=1 Tax=Actinomadura hibisca TaxID=68565 RepID=UPI000A60F029|nr:hypothetical protein [Actinomadura hibisca]
MPDHVEPDPSQAQTAAEFVACLRQLKESSGRSFRELERRARADGASLPASSAATALSRPTLPRPELVAVLVQACDGDQQQIAVWLEHRKRLAVLNAGAPNELHPDPSATKPEPTSSEAAPVELAPGALNETPTVAPTPDVHHRRPAARAGGAVVPALLAALVTSTVFVLALHATGWRTASSPDRPTPTRTDTPAVSLPTPLATRPSTSPPPSAPPRSRGEAAPVTAPRNKTPAADPPRRVRPLGPKPAHQVNTGDSTDGFPGTDDPVPADPTDPDTPVGTSAPSPEPDPE